MHQKLAVQLKLIFNYLIKGTLSWDFLQNYLALKLDFCHFSLLDLSLLWQSICLFGLENKPKRMQKTHKIDIFKLRGLLIGLIVFKLVESFSS